MRFRMRKLSKRAAQTKALLQRAFLSACFSLSIGCSLQPQEHPLDPTTLQGLLLSLRTASAEQLPVTGAVIWSRADDAFITSSTTICPERMYAGNISGPSVPVIAASVGGQSAFYFDGTTHLRGFAPQMQSNIMSVLTVFRRTVPSGTNALVGIGNGSGGFEMRLNANPLDVLKANVLGIVSGATAITNTSAAYIGTFTYDVAGNASVFINGTLDGSATNAQVFTLSPAHYTIGAKTDSTEPMEGYIAEVIVFPRAITSAERQLVECYLSRRYAITVPFSCE